MNARLLEIATAYKELLINNPLAVDFQDPEDILLTLEEQEERLFDIDYLTVSRLECIGENRYKRVETINILTIDTSHKI